MTLGEVLSLVGVAALTAGGILWVLSQRGPGPTAPPEGDEPGD